MSVIAVVETPSIKKYVFGTDKLVEIRGASALLDNLNRFELEKILSPGEKVFANGGSGQFIFDIPQEEVIEKLQLASKLYIEATCGGASLVWGVAEMSSDTMYQKTVSMAYADMHRRRFENPHLTKQIGMPLTKICESCQQDPVAVFVQYPESNWLCEICSTKRLEALNSKQKGVWQEFILSAQLDKRTEPARTLADITPRMAVVYADGNAMGRRIRDLESPGEYREFSEAVDTAIHRACFKGLKSIAEEYFSEKTPNVPADILLLGGDDLVVVLPADKALEFAYTVAESFENETEETLGQMITLSLGVVVGPPAYPFSFMLDYAEQLLSSAKEKAIALNNEEPPSTLDFHITTSSNSLDIKTIRSEYGLDCELFKRTRRPYTLDDLNLLFEIKCQFKAASFPKSRLNALYDALSGTHKQASYLTKKIWSSGRTGVRRVLTSALQEAGCYETMPWSAEKDTIITELVEFYDYLPDQWGEGESHA